MRQLVVPFLVSLLLAAPASAADPPPGYYETAVGRAGPELARALHELILNHQVLPYSSSTLFDTSDALSLLDEDPSNTNNVVGVYSRQSMPKSDFGLTTGWNREHVWPESYGVDTDTIARSDLYNLRAEDATVNSSRGNKYFDISDPLDRNYKSQAHPEAPLCSCDTDSWELPIQVQGDVARALFYMATCYQGTLALTSETTLIVSTNAFMGSLQTLLRWHVSDPVDDRERSRDELVFSFQGNRNPFVDHPEWVELVFSTPCTNPPTLNIEPAEEGILLRWVATNQSTRLEYTTNLLANWADVSLKPVLTNSEFRVTWNTQVPETYFRLRVIK